MRLEIREDFWKIKSGKRQDTKKGDNYNLSFIFLDFLERCCYIIELLVVQCLVPSAPSNKPHNQNM